MDKLIEDAVHIVINRESVKPELRGPLPRNWRNWFAAAALTVGAGGLMLAVTRWQRVQDATHLRALEEFKSAYAIQCDAPELQGPLPASVRDAYLHSHALQRVVVMQSAALRSGTGCQQIWQALRAADFPMPLAARTVEPDAP